MNERTRMILSFAAGVAAGAALPIVAPAVAEAGRPMVKALVKHSLVGFERLRTGIARASESLEDLVAEARAEAAETLCPSSAADTAADAARTDAAADTAPARPSLVVMG